MVPKIVPKNQIPRIAATTSSHRLNGYYLVPETEPGTRWPIEKYASVIGRGEDCDFVIEDNSISRIHCQLELVPRGMKIRDLHSTNGILVIGMPVSELYLNVGDVIHVGTFVLTFRNDYIARGNA